MAASSVPPWAEIPQDVLGLVIDRLASSTTDDDRRLPSKPWSRFLRLFRFSRGFKAARRARHSVDRARFRAVCRSWQSAMRQHAPALPQIPWIVRTDGSFLTPSDIVGTWPRRRIPSLPRNARCIASDGSWLLLDCKDVRKMHSYSLHNPFDNTTVPLPELGAVIGDVSKLFKVRKMRMRTTPCDVIALMTNNWNYPVILIRPGKGVWLPKPQAAPFVYIVDIAFLGDKLYGITKAEDLVYFGIDFDSSGIPTIATIDRLIRHPPRNYSFGVWSDGEDNFESANNYKGHMDELAYNEEPSIEELRRKTGDDMVLEGVSTWRVNKVPYEAHWYLVESCGKLLMVMRQLRVPSYTPKVEVYEADVNIGAQCWVRISGGLGGKTLFISRFLCKSISTYDEADKDAIHFIDTGEKYNMKSQTMSKTLRNIDYLESMWMFSVEPVV